MTEKRIKRTIQEYGGAEEEFDELRDEIFGSFDEVYSAVIEKEKSDKSEQIR